MTLMRGAVKAFFISVVVMLSPGVHAQGIPVYDNLAVINSFTGLVNDVTKIKHLYDQVKGLQQQLQAITGGRGMENLLGNINRDYLPKDLGTALGDIQQMQQQYGQIAQNIQRLTQSNGVLSAVDFAKLPPDAQQMLNKMRQAVAAEQALTQEAYKNAANNVNNLKQLIAAIGGAGDAKAIADLSARIQVEQAMLQNDAIRLQQATAMHAAEQRLIDQQLHEKSIAMGTGSLSDSPIRILPPQNR